MNSKLIKIILSMLMCAVTIFILHILLPSFPQLIIIMEIVIAPLEHLFIDFLCEILTNSK